MRILHLAQHAPRDNADENSITHALRVLGHDVLTVEEVPWRLRTADVLRFGPDFLLTHKADPEQLKKIPCRKAFWYFDMIESDDWDLQARSKARRAWLDEMTDSCDVGFLTDGDAVARDTTGKLHHLMQGADERVTGPWGSHPGEDRPPPTPEAYNWTGDILFTGSVIHGGVRATFVDEMERVWGRQFLRFGHHAKDRVHGRRLAELMACAKVVVCPDGPVTDRYFSNRLIQACGFGAFVMHPKSAFVDVLYPAQDVIQYDNRQHLHDLLAVALDSKEDLARGVIANRCYRTTMERNLYRHRCAQLVETVRNRWGLK